MSVFMTKKKREELLRQEQERLAEEQRRESFNQSLVDALKAIADGTTQNREQHEELERRVEIIAAGVSANQAADTHMAQAVDALAQTMQKSQSMDARIAETIAALSQAVQQGQKTDEAISRSVVTLTQAVQHNHETDAKMAQTVDVLAQTVQQGQKVNEAIVHTVDSITAETARNRNTDVDIARAIGAVADSLSALHGETLPADRMSSVPTLPFDIDEQTKLRAAYALNLCTVSVSQIVDYNDLYILEQEYDTILNNLNLELMPKDEALLDILKQLLDTIAFFRLQGKEKERLEKQYQKKMKAAIWSATPNLTAVVAAGGSGGWIAMAVSLAIQIGSGYMNYRKRKAEIQDEQSEKEWEMSKSALEQFDALRRALFATAWRLADAYGFPDEYRLTERQINQYNDILMDSNLCRRYNRLKSIETDFRAYPPFWYYIGNTAIRLADPAHCTQEELDYYRGEVKKYYSYFFEFSQNHALLRLNQIAASCYLEYADLLMLEGPDTNRDNILTCINEAKRYSGNACDVLQICMMDYLKLGETGKAEKVLLQLVNERYNVETNAAYLSFLYALDYTRAAVNNRAQIGVEYRMLQKCVDNADPGKLWFPLEICNQAVVSRMLEEFRQSLKEACDKVLDDFCGKYRTLFNRQLPEMPEMEADFGTYFKKYHNRAKFEKENAKLDWAKAWSVLDEMFRILTDTSSPVQVSESDREALLLQLKGALRSGLLSQYDVYTDTCPLSQEDTCMARASALFNCFESITQDFMSIVKTWYLGEIDELNDYNQIMLYDMSLRDFCADNDLIYSYNSHCPVETKQTITDTSLCLTLISSEMQDIYEEHLRQDAESRQRAYFTELIREYRQTLGEQADIWEQGDPAFEQYREKHRDKNVNWDEVIFILDDHGSQRRKNGDDKEDSDLLLSGSRLYVFEKSQWILYQDISFSGLDKALHWDYQAFKLFGKDGTIRHATYTHDFIDLGMLYRSIIKKFADYNEQNDII